MTRSLVRRSIDRLQLGLPFSEPASTAPPPVPTPPLAVAAQPPAPTTTSRTRALIDAIQAHIPHARVVLTDNRSVLLSQQKKGGEHVVRVHQMFLDAPADVRDATAHFLAHGDRGCGRVVDAFIDAQGHLLSHAARPLAADAHVGRVHDLLICFHAVNDRYFEGRIRAEIGWGRGGRRARRARSSITFGSYDHRAERIVIHPVLDQPHVPALVVARVVHHEMLHARHGEQRDAHGRRVVHGRAFHVDEKRFDGAKEADGWLEAHMDTLLRFRPAAPERPARGDKTR